MQNGWSVSLFIRKNPHPFSLKVHTVESCLLYSSSQPCVCERAWLRYQLSLSHHSWPPLNTLWGPRTLHISQSPSPCLAFGLAVTDYIQCPHHPFCALSVLVPLLITLLTTFLFRWFKKKTHFPLFFGWSQEAVKGTRHVTKRKWHRRWDKEGRGSFFHSFEAAEWGHKSSSSYTHTHTL